MGDVDNITKVPYVGLDASCRRLLPPRWTAKPHWTRQDRSCTDCFWYIVFPFIASSRRPNLLELSRYLWRWRHRVFTIQRYKVDSLSVDFQEYSVKDCSLFRTDADFKDYIRTYWLHNATDEKLEPLWTYYKPAPSEGSPFGRGSLNLDRPYPQFNRLAAFQGDMVFQGPRRALTKALSSRGQKTWVYCTLVKPLAVFFYLEFTHQ